MLASYTLSPSASDNTQSAEQPAAVRMWLLLCCLGIAWMVAIGGWTRLTDSGLSMTDWRPVTGVLPPLSADAWQAEFDAYRQSPQYQLLNQGMSMDEFRRIFWPEFLHRLSGRIVGLLFFIPFIYFMIRGAFAPRARLYCIVAAAGGCAQGLVGWWMVKSGLSDAPYVSHYRLAFHLSMAFFLFSMLYLARLSSVNAVPKPNISQHPNPPATRNEQIVWAILFVLTMVQIILGAFVAGKDAGHAFSDFPLMAGALIPPGTVPLFSDIDAALADPVTLHVLHRLSGYALWTGGIACALYMYLTKRSHAGAFAVIACFITAQAMLGAWTVMSGVDIIAASVHQLFALGLFAFFIRTGYILYNHNH